MANNVAKLEGENYWVCVQNSTNTVFLPLFQFELAAYMFAESYREYWRTSNDFLSLGIYRDNYQEELSIDLRLFLQTKFGTIPEAHPAYIHYVAGWKQNRGSELRRESVKLYCEFLEWRCKRVISLNICRANPPHGAEYIKEREIDNIQKNCGKLDDEELYYCTMCAQFDFVIGERK